MPQSRGAAEQLNRDQMDPGTRSESEPDSSRSAKRESSASPVRRIKHQRSAFSSSSDEAAETALWFEPGIPVVTKAHAFKVFVTNGYVAHSLDIGTFRNGKGEEKKSPKYYSIKWRDDPSTFIEIRNSLSIDCGRSGLIVIDVDLPALDAWTDIVRDAGIEAVDTFTVRTGSGGLHLYFKATDDVSALNKTNAGQFLRNGEKLHGLDVRGVGGVIFAPPSAYMTLSGEKRRYDIINYARPADMPPDLYAELKSMLPPLPAAAPPPGHRLQRGGAGVPAAAPAPIVPGVFLGGEACTPHLSHRGGNFPPQAPTAPHRPPPWPENT